MAFALKLLNYGIRLNITSATLGNSLAFDVIEIHLKSMYRLR